MKRMSSYSVVGISTCAKEESGSKMMLGDVMGSKDSVGNQVSITLKSDRVRDFELFQYFLGRISGHVC